MSKALDMQQLDMPKQQDALEFVSLHQVLELQT
jgi:hypothetical protein